jgi:hypothetical protein
MMHNNAQFALRGLTQEGAFNSTWFIAVNQAKELHCNTTANIISAKPHLGSTQKSNLHQHGRLETCCNDRISPRR